MAGYVDAQSRRTLSWRTHARVAQHAMQSRKGGLSTSSCWRDARLLRNLKSAFQRRLLKIATLIGSRKGTGGFAEQNFLERIIFFPWKILCLWAIRCHKPSLPVQTGLGSACLPIDDALSSVCTRFVFNLLLLALLLRGHGA